MIDEHRQLWAIWDAMGAAAQEHSDRANAARVERAQQERARQEAEREAVRQAQLAEARREMEADALTYRAQGPVCGAMYHDSRGAEVSCRLDQGHELGDPTCDAGNGVTWPHYED
jgi:hypothetical protein